MTKSCMTKTIITTTRIEYKDHNDDGVVATFDKEGLRLQGIISGIGSFRAGRVTDETNAIFWKEIFKMFVSLHSGDTERDTFIICKTCASPYVPKDGVCLNCVDGAVEEHIKRLGMCSIHGHNLDELGVCWQCNKDAHRKKQEV